MVNKVVLIGNLGRDPELFHTQSIRRSSCATGFSAASALPAWS